tara:strand:- start:114053 stop:115555 length:1503 start_codon:yes stop_codon:yes gene_type:complete
MPNALRIFAAILALIAGAGGAWAEPRIALIIGNGGYASVTQLDNPVPDAELMAATLRENGFEVTVLTDGGQIALNRAISQFGRDLRGAGKDATGLFYYAGHAVQSFGENYLLPVDASLTDAADLSLVGVPADAILRQMRSARNKTNIVILDACRNNPFEAIPDLNDNGLAEMKAPTGTFLSYSTAPGAVALDGLDGNSPFTKALAAEIPVPGVPIEQAFKKVRVTVIAETKGQQTPWDTSSLTGDFFFQAKEQLSAEQLQEQQLWKSVKGSGDPVQIMLFLRSYPNGLFQTEARTLLSATMAAELQPPPPATAPEVAALQPEPSRAATPEPSEQSLIAAAQASGTAADYQAYLDAFPTGTYAELAAYELKVIQENADRASAKAPVEEPVETAPTVAPAKPTDLSSMTFSSPFPTGNPAIQGRSIEEVVKLSPLFPPIEGLPEELWKDQTCSNCHEWTREALCTQGKTYVSANNERAISKTHPFGGTFKQGLRAWASADCP